MTLLWACFWILALAFSSKLRSSCIASVAQDICFLVFLSWFLFFFFSHLSLLTAPSTFLPRPGVPLGAKAICRGGGRASAQEQQADNRQQLSGGTLRGSVFLGTLGECRQRGWRGPCFFFVTFKALYRCQNKDISKKTGQQSWAGRGRAVSGDR